jgi:hypothetical protein
MPLLPEDLQPAPSGPASYAAAAALAQQSYDILAAHHAFLHPDEGSADPSRMLPPGQKTGRDILAAKDLQTQHPLTYEETSVVICLPSSSLNTTGPEEATLIPYDCAGPVTHTCHSYPHPTNIIFRAPCNLSLPWVRELGFQYTR